MTLLGQLLALLLMTLRTDLHVCHVCQMPKDGLEAHTKESGQMLTLQIVLVMDAFKCTSMPKSSCWQMQVILYLRMP